MLGGAGIPCTGAVEFQNANEDPWRATFAPREEDKSDSEPGVEPPAVHPAVSHRLMKDVAEDATGADQQKRREDKQRQAQLAERRRALKQFLRKNGFGDVNDCKTGCMFSKSYPLHAAVEKNNLRVVEMLLAEGADPTQTNSSGKTAAELAQRKNKKGARATMVQVLQSACKSDRAAAAAGA
jgi:ankyrin repeat protein